MKTVLFVPGYQEHISTRNYKKTIRAIEESGYVVVFVEIDWMRTTIDDWVAQLNRTYEKYDPKDTILAGFSFGAMTVLAAATERNPSEVWLFSLSPFFGEDITTVTYVKSWLRQIGHRRTDAFKKMLFTKLIQKIRSKTIYFYGEMELTSWPDIAYRHEALGPRRLSKTVLIPAAKHDVTSDIYIKTIIKNI